MKKTNTLTIRELVGEFIEQNKIDTKLYETRIRKAWLEIMGPLAKSTENIQINGRILFVKLTSSVIRNELLMRRSEICKALNEKLGKDLLIDIILR